ncbi:hypothetical protein OsI_32105 [Oryza sativa Indica Group]|uniref:Uncharacterized protein n=1 Tax=Oryza sativa subsp. indica TaxID=39946 RepID=B8BDM1_ORYSI|nr:hypothetical protein OsI_32105 [Oryza sativa Indica Group]
MSVPFSRLGASSASRPSTPAVSSCATRTRSTASSTPRLTPRAATALRLEADTIASSLPASIIRMQQKANLDRMFTSTGRGWDELGGGRRGGAELREEFLGEASDRRANIKADGDYGGDCGHDSGVESLYIDGFHICNEGTRYRLKGQPMHSAKDIDEKSENKYYRKSPFSLKQNDEGSCSTAVGIALLRSAACSLFQMHSAGMSCVVVDQSSRVDGIEEQGRETWYATYKMGTKMTSCSWDGVPGLRIAATDPVFCDYGICSSEYHLKPLNFNLHDIVNPLIEQREVIYGLYIALIILEISSLSFMFPILAGFFWPTGPREDYYCPAL